MGGWDERKRFIYVKICFPAPGGLCGGGGGRGRGNP